MEADYGDEFYRDRYGMLDFEANFDSEDEDDVRDAVKKGFGLGRWVDGVVDVFLKLEEDEPEPDLEAGEPRRKAQIVEPEREPDVVSGESIEAAPDRPRGIWEDVQWFGRVVARTIQS